MSPLLKNAFSLLAVVSTIHQVTDATNTTNTTKIEVETNSTVSGNESPDSTVTASLVIGIGNRLVIQECRYGPFLLNTMDTFIEKAMITYGEWSEASFQVAKTFINTGDLVLDIGASIGALTIPFAKAVGPSGRVMAFEPQRILSQQIATNVVLNQVNNVEIINTALGNHDEKLIEVPKVNYYSNGDFGSLSLLNDWKSAGAMVELVPFMRLDDIFLFDGAKCPSFIKVDSGGMEVEVLKGGEKLIDACKPVLQVRADCSRPSRDIIEFLSAEALNYTCHWEVHERFHVNNFANEATSIYNDVDRFSTDLLCFHVDRITLTSNLTVPVDVVGGKYKLDEYDIRGFGKITQNEC